MTSTRSHMGPKTEQAKRLVDARLRAGFQRAKEAADACGWNYETYIQHERGQRGLQWAVARKYATAFGVPHGWLMLEPGAVGPGAASGSQPMQAASRPLGAARAAPSGIPPAGIERTLRIDRNALIETARKAIEFALVDLGQPTAISESRIAQLAEFATQRVLIGRAE